MAVKRRTIWMDDERWNGLVARAKALSVNPSAYISAAVETGEMFVKYQPRKLADPADVARTQAAMDAIVEYRPVPKPSQRRK